MYKQCILLAPDVELDLEVSLPDRDWLQHLERFQATGLTKDVSLITMEVSDRACVSTSAATQDELYGNCSRPRIQRDLWSDIWVKVTLRNESAASVYQWNNLLTRIPTLLSELVDNLGTKTSYSVEINGRTTWRNTDVSDEVRAAEKPNFVDGFRDKWKRSSMPSYVSEIFDDFDEDDYSRNADYGLYHHH